MRPSKKPNLPPQPQTATITRLSHDGRGISAIQGKTTFISNALPGEEVLFRYTHQHGRYDEGRSLQVLGASPERRLPRCPHFGICGGCSLQHLSIEAQLTHKQQMLLEQLQHFGKVQPETILPPLTDEPWAYRRRARLGVQYDEKNKKLTLGFRQENSATLTAINTCDILDPRLGHQLELLRMCLLQLNNLKFITHIEVAMGDTEVALLFRHIKPLTGEDLQQLRTYGQQEQFSIYLQPSDPASIYKLYPEDQREYLTYQLPEYQLEYHFHPSDFIQINSRMNHHMVPAALDLLKPQKTDTILDLFCGLGNFTLPLAQQADQVIAIEGEQGMVERAQQNAALNDIRNARFYTADLTQDWTKAPWFTRKINKVLLDPPRSGAQAIIQQLRKLKLDSLVYVSCNPATLARDAGLLVQEQGYRLKTLGMLDMFPQTSHIEAIALFTK